MPGPVKFRVYVNFVSSGFSVIGTVIMSALKRRRQDKSRWQAARRKVNKHVMNQASSDEEFIENFQQFKHASEDVLEVPECPLENHSVFQVF